MTNIKIIKYDKNNNYNDWICKQHAKTIFQSLSEIQKNNISLNIIEKKIYEKNSINKENNIILIGTIDNKPVCFIWFEITQSGFTDEKIGYILDIYVEKKYRNQGFGKKLINKMICDLKEKKISRVDLNVYKDNNAKFLYKSMGFENTMERMSLKIL